MVTSGVLDILPGLGGMAARLAGALMALLLFFTAVAEEPSEFQKFSGAALPSPSLLEFVPGLVNTAESFFEQVYFVPVSALGRIPEFDESREMIGIKPDHLKPLWAEVPFLLQLYLHNLLGGVETAVKNAVEITNYKFVHDTILFSLPGLPRRQQLPRNYWGKTLYCDETQQYFRLPFPPEESAASEQEKAGKNGLDDSNSLIDTTFWAN